MNDLNHGVSTASIYDLNIGVSIASVKFKT